MKPLFICVAGIFLAVLCLHGQQPSAAPSFRIDEATIAQIHAAMKAGQLTCRALVEQYMRRIEAYDKNGPAINAIVVVNPDALAQANDLDRRFAQDGLTGPLQNPKHKFRRSLTPSGNVIQLPSR